MHAAARSAKVAKARGVSQAVAKEYVAADHARGKKKLPLHVKKGVKHGRR
jgi:hypothetical protein